MLVARTISTPRRSAASMNAAGAIGRRRSQQQHPWGRRGGVVFHACFFHIYPITAGLVAFGRTCARHQAIVESYHEVIRVQGKQQIACAKVVDEHRRVLEQRYWTEQGLYIIVGHARLDVVVP